MQIANAQNLVPNPSFEEYSECPDNGSQLERTDDWHIFNVSPDYYNKCSYSSSGFSIPYNWTGYQCANTGNGYIGLYTYISNPNTLYREIVFSKLNDSLIIGKKYFVTMSISFADNSICSCNNIGLLFTTYNDTTISVLNNFAQIYAESINTDTLNWIKIKGSFISDSTYKYIYIGNFFNNINTDTILQAGATYCYSYYYIDDICVSEDSLTCVDITNEIIDFNANTTTVKQDSCVNYSINTVVDYDYYEWNFEGGNPSTSNLANPTVCYDSVGTFSTTLIAYNNTCADTIIKNSYITVTKPEGIAEFSNSFELINNPYDNYIIIKPKTSVNINNINIYDILGKQIKTSISKTTGLIKITLNQNTKNGIYILKITNNKNKSFSKKIVKI